MTKKLHADDLFVLIQSLTKEEKRYFKLFAQNSGGQSDNYLKLFDAIDKQTEYDEEELKRKLQRQKVDVRHFAAHKVYLYQLILKCLQLFYQEASAEEEILSGLKYLKILFRKRLMEQAQVLLDKLLEQCIRFDKLFYLPRLYEWVFVLQNTFGYYKEWALPHFEHYDKLYKQSADKLSVYVGQRQYLSRALIQMWQLSPYSRNNDLKDWIEANWNDEKPDYFDVSLSVHTAYAQGQAFMESGLRDSARCLSLWLDLADFIENSQQQWLSDSDTQRIYASALVSAMGFATDTQQWDLVEISRQRLEKNVDKKLIPVWVEYLKVHQSVLSKMRQGFFEQALETSAQLMDMMQSPQAGSIPKMYKLTGRFLMSILCLGLRRWDEAENHLQYAIEQSEDFALLIYNQARILLLVIYYEKGEFLMMPYSARSIYRALLKDQHLYDFERIFLQCLRRLSQAANKQEEHDILDVFCDKMAKFNKWEDNSTNVDREPLFYFDYIAWLESRRNYCRLDEWLRKQLTIDN